MNSRIRGVKLTNNTLRSVALEALTHSCFDAQRVQRFVILLPLLWFHCLPQFRFDCRHRHTQLFNLLLNFVSFGPRLVYVRRWKKETTDGELNNAMIVLWRCIAWKIDNLCSVLWFNLNWCFWMSIVLQVYSWLLIPCYIRWPRSLRSS